MSMSDLLQGMANGDYSDHHHKGAAAAAAAANMEEWEKRFDQLKRKHDFQAGLERPFGMPPLFYNNMYMRECEKAFRGSDPYSYELKLPFLHDLIRKFADQRMDYERQHQHQPQRPSFAADLSMHKGYQHSSASGLGNSSRMTASGTSASATASPGYGHQVELKIPSYKPMRSYNNSNNSNTGLGGAPLRRSPSPECAPSAVDHEALNLGPNKINDTLKDIIAKTIAEKVRTRSQMAPGFTPPPPPYCPTVSLPYENGIQGSYSASSSSSSGVECLGEPPAKRSRVVGSRSLGAPSTAAADSEGSGCDMKKEDTECDQKPAKKTRPKRGQYRKYNSQLVVEAVKAVQR